jgi:hypothetical protein
MLALLTIVLLGFALMLGFITPGRAMNKLMGMILGIIFFPFLHFLAKGLWGQVPLLIQMLMLLLAPLVLFLVGVRFFLGRGVWHEFMGHVVYDLFRGLLKLVLATVRLSLQGFGILIGEIQTAYRSLSH